MVAAADTEVILPFPARITPARHARSTLILASISSLRQRGHFDDYERALDPAHRDALLGAVAATWIPLDAARAHYLACDTLPLTADQQVQAGRTTFDATRGTLLGTAVSLARNAGVTPWRMLPFLQRFWERGFDGGGVRVVRAGPKDATVSLVQCALVSIPYFRNGLRGLLAAMVDLFCTRVYVTDAKHGAANVDYRVQWA